MTTPLPRVPTLGIGLAYHPAEHDPCLRHRAARFLQVSPQQHLEDAQAAYAEAYALREGRPLVGAGRALSLATDAAPTPALVAFLAKWARAARAPWYGEPLALSRVPAPGVAGPANRRRPLIHGAEVHDLQTPVALPPTEGLAETATRNARAVAAALPCALLVENAPVLARFPDTGLTEGDLLARVLSASGAGLRLNLVSLLATAATLRQEPASLLATYPLERVVQVTLTGAQRVGAAPVPDRGEPVPGAAWALLARVLPRAPVRAVLLERDPASPTVPGELQRIEAVWRDAYGPPPAPLGVPA